MDRNTVIGFVLIGLLMMGMFYFNTQGNKAYLVEQKRVADSIAKTKPAVDTVKFKQDSASAATVRIMQAAGGFQSSINKPEEITEVDNGVIKVIFTNKGGQPKKVELTQYKTFRSACGSTPT